MNNELNALVQRLLSGDASVLDDIYSTTEGYVRAFVGKKILGKNVEACIEEIYVKFFSVAKDADLSKFDAQKVLRSIIVEVISDESAKDETLSPLDIKLWSGKDDGSDPSKESRIDPNVATNLIDRVFSQIKETDAEATALFYVQGRRLSEVSQHLAMPEKKVKDILYSAKNKIISEIKRMRDNGEIDLFGMNPISYFAWLLHSERSPQALKEIKEQLSSVLPFVTAKNTNDVEVKKQTETVKESTSEKNASEKMEKPKEVETHSKAVNESNKSEKANVAAKVDVAHTEKTASSGNVESVDSTNSTDGMGNVDRTGNTDNIENMDRTADAESTFDTVPLSKEPISQNESVAEGEQEQIELPKEENMDDEPAQYIQGNVKSKKAKKEQEDSVQPVEAYHAKRRRSKRHEQESEATKISTAESTAESVNEEASSEMTGAKVANSANSDHSETSTVEATATVEITSTDAWYSYENGDEPTQDYMDEGDGDLEDDPEKSQGEQEDDASDGEDFEEEYTDAYEEEFHRSDYENLNEEEFVARRTQQLLDDDDQEVDMPSFVLNEDKNDEDDGEEDFYALVNQQKKRRKWPWIIIAILCLCGIVFAAKVWKDRNSHKVADAVVKEESQSASAVDVDKNGKSEKKDETSSAAVVASGTASAESGANGSEGSESQSAQAQETTMAVASSTAYKAIYRNLVNTMADSNHVFESGENIGVDQYGYNVYDMNNDGIPELILHYIGNPSCDAVFYTIGTDGNPVQLGTEAGDLRTGYCESPDHSCLYRYSSNGPDTIYERLTIANGRLNVEKLDVLPEGLVDSSGQFTTPMLRLYDKSDLKGLE